MVMFANQPPYVVYIRTRPAPDCHSRPPQLGGGGGMNLTPKLLSTVGDRLSSGKSKIVCLVRIPNDRRQMTNLPLAELESLPRALLSILLALFRAGIASYHAFRLQLLAQLCVKQHERACNSQTHGFGLPGNSAAIHASQYIEVRPGLSQSQGLLGAYSLGRRHEVFFE